MNSVLPETQEALKLSGFNVPSNISSNVIVRIILLYSTPVCFVVTYMAHINDMTIIINANIPNPIRHFFLIDWFFSNISSCKIQKHKSINHKTIR